MMPLMKDIQVVVMMGGMGTRLGEMVATCPKPMLPVGDRPFFEYELTLLKCAGFERFLFCTGYLSSEIEDHFGDGSKYGIKISYVRDGENDGKGKALLGTGGALIHALPYLDEDFLLVYADSFMDIDYKEVVYRYFEAREEGASSLMSLLHNDGRYDTSNVVYKDGRLKLYDKKNLSSEMEYIDYGVNMFSRSALAEYGEKISAFHEEEGSDGIKFDLSDIQHELSVHGRLAGLIVDRRFYEIGRPESYREFISYAEERFDKPKKAAFLDRDGVLNEIVYNEDTELLDSPMKDEELKLLPGVTDAVSRLKALGYCIFVVTNQPAAAKGKTSLGNLFDVNKRLKALIPEIDEVFVCFHHPKGDSRCREKNLIKKCRCRKPETGLIEEACLKYRIDRERSFMAGDSYTDIQCGRAAGLKTVFLGDLKCDVCARLEYNKPDIIAPSLAKAVGELT